ncbi:MAG: peptidoglycan DD-metalloendopeptidase family protein [Pseudonocardiaceae bacterium]|nr:peptidoglycan DD-metalloendopeptidase family protein [Pseudonocardiaceae bacterium]
MQRARIKKANTDSTARAALEQARARRQAAAKAKTLAEDTYRAAAAADKAAQRRSAELLARKADLESRLADAKGGLYELETQRDRYQQWQSAKEAAATAHAAAQAQAAAAQQDATGQAQQVAPQPAPDPGGVLAPTTGVITSTYGARWGTIHYGLDIANDIGTPIVSVMDGQVVSSGPASGFGLWVRVRHPDSTMTVYGHIHESLVSVGEWVVAGEQIATMGSRGQSTGPHLHFEVERNGSKIAPLVWLRGQGAQI